MPSETKVETKRSLFGSIPRIRGKNRDQTIKATPENVVEDLERSLTKDDPLIENNTFNGDADEQRKKFIVDELNEDTNNEEDNENIISMRERKVWWPEVVATTFTEGNVRPGTSTTLRSVHILKIKERRKHEISKQGLSAPIPSSAFGSSKGRLMRSHKESSVLSTSQNMEDKNSNKVREDKSTTECTSGMTSSTGQPEVSNNLSTNNSLHVSDLDGDVHTLWQADSCIIRKLVKEEDDDNDKDDKKKLPAHQKKLRMPKIKLPKKFRKKQSNKAESHIEEESYSERDVTKDGLTEEEVEKNEEEGKHGEEQSISIPLEEDDKKADDIEHVQDKPVAKPRQLSDPMQVEQNQYESIQTVDETKPLPKRRKKKKKVAKKKIPQSDEEPETREEPVIPTFPDESQTPASTSTRRARTARRKARSLKRDDGLVLGVTVHQCDHLRASLKYISHPAVRVSLVDGGNGQFLLKSDSARSVTSYYESDSVTQVLPMMTQPFDFRTNQSILPRWEESLIFNESYESLITSLTRQQDAVTSQQGEDALVPVNPRVVKPSPMVFFVIRDFVSMTKANNVRKGKDDVDKGWHNVAWAFLKLIGSNGQPNAGRKVRLQLFHPPRQLLSAPDAQSQSEAAYFWWRDAHREPYPSTLYVTLKAVNRPNEMDPASRSMFATQPECGTQSVNQAHSSLQFADGSQNASEEDKRPKWSRLAGQTCKIPNAVVLRLWSGSDGAFSIRFSNAGTRLAVACKHENSYPILLYGIPGGGEMGCLNGHQQLIYDIQWSNNDEKVVSSSADGTAQVWELKDKSKASHTLPHPAYVYTASFHPSAQHIVATGGYDCVIRVWNIATTTAQMLQELDGHKSFINSLAFDHTGLTMYSADSNGLVLAWNCHAHEKARKNYKTSWTMKTKYEDRELSGVCINCIEVHPRNNKLLLHCRDSVMRILDVRIHTLIQLTGAVSHRQHLRSALSACGSFVISGSEDGCAYVWNADSGDQVAIYNELGFSRSVRDVSFHPHEHMVAFCCFYPNMPVLVFKYDKGVAALGAGILPVVASSQPAKDIQVEALDDSVGADRHNTAKVSRIKQQLDAVLPKDGYSSDVSTWNVARKAVPVVMATQAFARGRKYEGQSSPRGVSSVYGLPATREGHLASPYGQQLDPLRGSFNTNELTWGSTFDTTMASSVEPAFFSPHASPEARAIAHHQAANRPRLESSGGWRPTFAAVGGSPYRSGVGPDVSINIDEHGKRSLQVTTTAPIKNDQTVVALYDYQANRSDELTMARGDLIKLLYKDGESWWFGELLSDGRQGYFPSNYVALEDNESLESKLETRDNHPEVMFGVPDDPRPISAASDPGSTTHALRMTSGKVSFYSHADSDMEVKPGSSLSSVSSRQRRREQRTNGPIESTPLPRSRVPDSIPPPSGTQSPAESTSSPRGRKSNASSPRARPRKRSPKQQTPGPSRPLPAMTQQIVERKGIVVESVEESESEPVYAKVQKRPKAESKRKVLKFEADNSQVTTVLADVHSIPEGARVKPANDDVMPSPATRQRFGIVEAAKQKLAENDSLLSKTILDGPDFHRDDVALGPHGPLAPILTSTASKPKRSRSRQKRNTSRIRAPRVLVTGPSEDASEDLIPMVELRSQKGRDVSGAVNSAYDGSSEA